MSENNDKETSHNTAENGAGNDGAAKDTTKQRDCGCLFLNWWDMAIAWFSLLLPRRRS